MWQTGAAVPMLGCSRLGCVGCLHFPLCFCIHRHLAGWVAQMTCRTEAYASLGVWYCEHKDPSWELTCIPPGTQYGLSSRLTFQAGRGASWGVGVGSLGQMSTRPIWPLWTFWGDKARTANVMNKECGVAGMKVLFAHFPTGGFVLHAFLESSCQVSWTPEKGWICCFSRQGGSKSSVHRGNKPGEGEVKGSN